MAFQIGDLISAWSYESPLEMKQVRRGDQVETVLTAIRPVPPRASLLFSEAVNHIRAALDNMVWHLVEAEHGPLEGRAALLVAMPITETPEAFERWCKARTKAGLAVFGGDSALATRLHTLQPFADRQQVPSVGATLASVMGIEVETAHPLQLLQAYSNADKHRAVRIAVARTISNHSSSPLLSQDLAHRELRVSEVLARATWGTPVLMETNTAAMVQRPEPWAAWVNPAKELTAMRRYVAQVAVPVLLTGLELPSGLPPEIDLGDSKAAIRERLEAGGYDDADIRLTALVQERFRMAMDRDWAFPDVVDAAGDGSASVPDEPEVPC
ncbi:hypothetical protein GCM10023081_45710 [Arthrobacter ginkgonis]|uniref:Uncharacterized protein n=1 Tax=Arthrobacter ginkgonis TaxID=1630594 RepID=A0ABP7DIR3_9MICC